MTVVGWTRMGCLKWGLALPMSLGALGGIGCATGGYRHWRGVFFHPIVRE